MARKDIIAAGMAGVDMTTNPLFLPEDKLAGATNMVFKEGSIQTRPAFRYHEMGSSGQFQGACVYSPSRGLSHQPFADPHTALVTVVAGKLGYNLSKDGYLDTLREIEGDFCLCQRDVHLYQAENYLIVQSPFYNTFWWEGYGPAIASPGLDADPDTVKGRLVQANLHRRELAGANIECCFQKVEYCETEPLEETDEEFSSHDTFIKEKHRNFLINSAGLGAYTNGRIHQEGAAGIYVGDLIHKRGTLVTDDILLMEEQQAGSFGDPLSTNSKMGQLRAIEVLPSMNSANGEGELIAYYDNGVVRFDTFMFPRETRVDEETLDILQSGWSEKQQVNHLLGRVSATGRYAVGVLPRDHAFRSRYGIHLLKTALGEGTFNDEYINTLSQDVQPILDHDMKSDLRGTTVGQWVEGSRLLTSVGMIDNSLYSSSPMGRGFVVWNQATTFTEDRTPRPIWEGLWSPHSGIAGVHKLVDVTDVSGDNLFGFVASKENGELVFGEIDNVTSEDCFENKTELIEWDVTSRKLFGGFDILHQLSDGRVEVESLGKSTNIRVMVRTDRCQKWGVWKEYRASNQDDRELHSIDLETPPKEYREASWFQFRVEGMGRCELRLLEADITPDREKMEAVVSTVSVGEEEKNFHRINQKPATDRWT